MEIQYDNSSVFLGNTITNVHLMNSISCEENTCVSWFSPSIWFDKINNNKLYKKKKVWFRRNIDTNGFEVQVEFNEILFTWKNYLAN